MSMCLKTGLMGNSPLTRRGLRYPGTLQTSLSGGKHLLRSLHDFVRSVTCLAAAGRGGQMQRMSLGLSGPGPAGGRLTWSCLIHMPTLGPARPAVTWHWSWPGCDEGPDLDR